jgi:hypothetical protein
MDDPTIVGATLSKPGPAAPFGMDLSLAAERELLLGILADIVFGRDEDCPAMSWLKG